MFFTTTAGSSAGGAADALAAADALVSRDALGEADAAAGAEAKPLALAGRAADDGPWPAEGGVDDDATTGADGAALRGEELSPPHATRTKSMDWTNTAGGEVDIRTPSVLHRATSGRQEPEALE